MRIVNSDERLESAEFAAWQANRIGGIIMKFAEVLFWLQYAALVVALIVIFMVNRSDDGFGSTEINWDAILFGWGSVLGVWMIYCFGLAIIAAVGAVAQAKAESLEIQIEQARS